MAKWWNWLFVITLICFVFLVVPLLYSTDNTKEELRPMFDEYIQKFNKSYKNNPEEYETRLEHFVASIQEIEQLNAASRGPEQHRAKYGLTRLSDMSKTEFQEIHLSDEKPHHKRRSRKSGSKYMDNNVDFKDELSEDDDKPGTPHYNIVRKKRAAAAAIPMHVDWREKGVIGPVRDQGLCGACWAFSTIGAMEAMTAIQTGKLEPLSVQEAIDCAGLGNSGCAGGDICLLLDWLLMTDTAVEPDKAYPLRLSSGVCHKKVNGTGVKVAKFTCDDMVGAEDKIIESIANHGPVAVAVNALTWQNYLGGVIQYHCSGKPIELNHAVQLIGYDLTADVPYYIAKNSWGKSFGVGGYLQLAIGNNICGLATEVASVDVKP